MRRRTRFGNFSPIFFHVGLLPNVLHLKFLCGRFLYGGTVRRNGQTRRRNAIQEVTRSISRLTCSETFSATEPNQLGTEHLKSTNSTKPPMFIVINHNLRLHRETTSSRPISNRPGSGSHFYRRTGVLCHSQTHDHGDISSDSYSQDRQDEEDHKTKGEQNEQTNKQTNRKESFKDERDYAGATTVTSVAGATVQP